MTKEEYKTLQAILNNRKDKFYVFQAFLYAKNVESADVETMQQICIECGDAEMRAETCAKFCLIEKEGVNIPELVNALIDAVKKGGASYWLVFAYRRIKEKKIDYSAELIKLKNAVKLYGDEDDCESLANLYESDRQEWLDLAHTIREHGRKA